MRKEDGKVGMKVLFGRSNGEKTLGEIVKINRKNFKVKTLEARGTRRNHKVGSVWNVPPTLCKPGPNEKLNKTSSPRRKNKSYSKKDGSHDYRHLSKQERCEKATVAAKEAADHLKAGCDLANKPTYIKASRRYLDGTTIRKRGNEYDGQRQKLYDAERNCRRGETFDDFRQAERYFEKVLESAWFNRRFKRPDIQLLPGRGNSSAAYFNGNIRLSTRHNMYERILLHELVHTLIPLPHAGHGRLFCAVYLDFVRHFMGEDAYEELLEGYRREGVKYQPHRSVKR